MLFFYFIIFILETNLKLCELAGWPVEKEDPPLFARVMCDLDELV